MMNSVPVLCFPFLSFHGGKGDHTVIIEVLFALFFLLVPLIFLVYFIAFPIAKIKFWRQPFLITSLSLVQCFIDDVNEGCGLQIYLKRRAYTSLFWPDEWAHAFAFLFEPHWSWSLYFECHSTSIPLFQGSCSFIHIMIGIGYNLMQCYTILILSQAMLSLITSYSLGEKPTQLQSHILCQWWCQALPGI